MSWSPQAIQNPAPYSEPASDGRAGLLQGCDSLARQRRTNEPVRYVRSGGGQVGYRVVGSGPSAVWVPGTIAGAPPRS
jgi:hypothetical protein